MSLVSAYSFGKTRLRPTREQIEILLFLNVPKFNLKIISRVNKIPILFFDKKIATQAASKDNVGTAVFSIKFALMSSCLGPWTDRQLPSQNKTLNASRTTLESHVRIDQG